MSNLVALSGKLASRYGMDNAAETLEVLKATAFRSDKQVTDAQMTALLIVADQFGLNPWTKEIYAFPDKNNGIVPVVGIDGWSRIINDHDQFDGIEFEYGPPIDGGKHHEWIECVIYRKDRTRPIKAREFWGEVYRKGFGPWESHGNRMHRHKSLIQCSRIAFGFTGIYDQDEAERILEKDMGAAEVVSREKYQVSPRQDATPAIESKSQRVPNQEAPIEGHGEQVQHQQEANAELLTPNMIKMVNTQITKAGLSATDLCAHFKVGAVEEIPKANVNAALDWIKGKAGAQ